MCSCSNGECTITTTTIGIRLAFDFFQRTQEVVTPLNILEFPFGDRFTFVQFVLGSHTKSEHGDDDVGHIDACIGIGDKHLSYLSKVSYDFAVIMTDPLGWGFGFSKQRSRLDQASNLQPISLRCTAVASILA